jgi:S1-C subfamily serine protease
VRYVLITERIAEEQNLSVQYGVLVAKGSQGESAVMPDSPAQKAGILEGDIILEFNGARISPDNSLAKLRQKYNPKDTVVLKVLRQGQEKIFTVVLGERSE